MAFIVLRRDRPDAPQTVRLSLRWVAIAAVLAALNLAFVVFGARHYGLRPMALGSCILALAVVLSYTRTRADRRQLQTARRPLSIAGPGHE